MVCLHCVQSLKKGFFHKCYQCSTLISFFCLPLLHFLNWRIIVLQYCVDLCPYYILSCNWLLTASGTRVGGQRMFSEIKLNGLFFAHQWLFCFVSVWSSSQEEDSKGTGFWVPCNSLVSWKEKWVINQETKGPGFTQVAWKSHLIFWALVSSSMTRGY